MIIDFQRLIPGFWFQNHPTSLEWDDTLNKLMDTYLEPKVIAQHWIQFGSLEKAIKVWTSNYPYAYGSVYESPAGKLEVLPKVATRRRLRQYLHNIQYAKLGALVNDR